MTELRQDLSTRGWVVIAPERLKGRKIQKELNPLMDTIPDYNENCPFCPKNEGRFENIEHFNVPHPGPDNPFKSKWLARCIENKYKIFSSDDKNINLSGEFIPDEIYVKYPALGTHDLIIESPQHNKTFATMSIDEVKAAIKIYVRRYNELRKMRHTLLTIIFKNHGKSSGASQVHPHSQIVSMRIVPNYIRFLIFEAQRYFDEHGICVYCKISHNELKENKRIIYKNKRFFSFVPYAAMYPYMIHIMPTIHDSTFGDMEDDELHEYCDCLRKTLAKLYKGLSNPDFNLILRNPPYKMETVPFYHWYTEIIPHIVTPGGFEMGSRINVNVVSPEEAAEVLRNIDID